VILGCLPRMNADERGSERVTAKQRTSICVHLRQSVDLLELHYGWNCPAADRGSSLTWVPSCSSWPLWFSFGVFPARARSDRADGPAATGFPANGGGTAFFRRALKRTLQGEERTARREMVVGGGRRRCRYGMCVPGMIPRPWYHVNTLFCTFYRSVIRAAWQTGQSAAMHAAAGANSQTPVGPLLAPVDAVGYAPRASGIISSTRGNAR
jgi:hypothetical protein